MKLKLRAYLLIPFVYAFFVGVSFAQQESAIWYFGDFAGLDFNSGTPVPLTNSALQTNEGCATISDGNGNLMFYTDGTKVWNRQHQIMPNGTGLLGHSSSTESAIIIPKPGTLDIFYIFTIDKPSYFLTEDEPIDGVNYSEVDMNLDNGLGDIVVSTKNTHLITYDVDDPEQNEYKTSEKITAVTHSDGSTIWVITQFINKFYAFRVDFDGVNETPVISTVPQAVFPRIDNLGSNISAIGYLKVSPDGTKIAIAHSSTTLGSPNTGSKKSGKVLIYDFDNTTGLVSNETELLTNSYPYGIEFSPNSNLLYVTNSNFTTTDLFIDSNLFQFNLQSSDIAGSRTTINTSTNVAGALQLGIDGKIYRAGYPFMQAGLNLSIINNPNGLGTACGYSHNALYLEGRASQLGLPPFIQSIFKFTFDYEFVCFGDNTHFFITSEDPYESVVWDFGDGHTSTLETPYHTYAEPGDYIVSLTFTINNIAQNPIRKLVRINPIPVLMDDIYELVQCDSNDDDPNDGIATFNLDLAVPALTLNSTMDFDAYFYTSETMAISDTLNNESLNPIYVNQSQNELIYVKVYIANTECYNLGTIRLKTTQSVDLDVFEFESCDSQNNGMATFDLNAIRDEIISQLGLQQNVSISFYENEADAIIGVDPVDGAYMTGTATLYIRADSENACYGDGRVNLTVAPFPQMSDRTIDICETDFPILLNTGLDAFELSNYDFIWSTGQTAPQIMVSEPGSYSVTVIDPVLNCEGTSTIVVSTSPMPVIQSIHTGDNQATILLASGNEGFEFSVDTQVFQTSNSFAGLTPGSHVAYVKDLMDCNTVQQEFLIFGFPDFFTPNDDGIHDYWNAKGLDSSLYPTLRIYIFNRYGKLMHEFDPYTSQGWSGKFNNRIMPSDDYWYFMKLPDGKIYRGHFSLKL